MGELWWATRKYMCIGGVIFCLKYFVYRSKSQKSRSLGRVSVTWLGRTTITGPKRHIKSFCLNYSVFSVMAFIVYVRPIAEHNSVIWSPSLKHDIGFTKRLYGLKCLLYADRLSKLGLCSLELRGLHLDLILCYKIVLAWLMSVFNDFFFLIWHALKNKGSCV